MNNDDPVALDIIRHCMVARIATLSRNGRPSINPLYFIFWNNRIWLGTPEWTLAVRNVKADPRVSLLLQIEQKPQDKRVLRISGHARVRTDKKALLPYNLRVAFKYLLTPGALRNRLEHRKQQEFVRDYRAQNRQKGRSCVIEVPLEQVELLTAE